MIKYSLLLSLLILGILNKAQFLINPYYNESDKKIIELLSEIHSSSKTQSIEEFKHKYNADLLKESLKNEKVKSVVKSVFIAQNTAEICDGINSQSTQLFESALAHSKVEKRIDLEIWTALNFAFYYYTYRKYDKCFPLFMICMNRLEEIDDTKVINVSNTYLKIAYFLTTTQEYEKAKEFLFKALKYAKPNSSEIASVYNTLGFCYKQTNMLIEAKNYFYKTLSISKKCNDEVRYAKALGSLAELEFINKNYDRAINLLEKDIEISERKNNIQNSMYALVVLSKVYFEIGDIENSEKNLLKAKEYSKIKSYFKSSEHDIVEMLMKISQIKGDNDKELYLRRRLEKISDSLKDLDGKETVQNYAWESQKYQLKLKIEREKAEHDKDSYIKMVAILFCLLLIVIIIFVIRSYKHKMKAKKSNYEARVLNLTIDKINSENKLISTHKTIHSYQIYLEEKNKQIETLQLEIESVKKSAFSEFEEKSGNLQKLLESHLMTDENWKNFRKAFVQTYPLEFKKLQEKFPDLTHSNLRIIILTKLNMNNTEISRLLGVTLDAVKKAKHRLRKKYEDSHEELFELIKLKKPL